MSEFSALTQYSRIVTCFHRQFAYMIVYKQRSRRSLRKFQEIYNVWGYVNPQREVCMQQSAVGLINLSLVEPTRR